MSAPYEKAKELYDKFYPHAFHPSPIFNNDEVDHTKQCALIAARLLSDHTDLQYWDDVIDEIHKIEKS